MHRHVSIHAPTRGRPTKTRSGTNGSLFQSTPHAGATPTVRRASASAVFQSTPPRGGTLYFWFLHCFGRFNPRPHAGGDRNATITIGNVPNRWKVSIHAPTRGATTAIYCRLRRRFQSTPPRGGRRLRSPVCRSHCSENFRSHIENIQQSLAFTESAILPGFSWALEVRAGLENEWPFEFNGRFRAHMFNPPPPVASQHIEPEAVCLRVDQVAQAGT